MPERAEMLTLSGTGIGGGIVIGRARVLESRLIDVPRYRIDAAQTQFELERLDTAIAAVRGELAALASQLPKEAPAEVQALLDVHAMILDDPTLTEQARAAIAREHLNAEWAFTAHAEQLAAQFDQFEDPYLRERGRDVQQVADRVLKSLAGSQRARAAPDGDAPFIVVAHDIAPADMLQLRNAVGFAIDQGGPASHSAILARSLNVAAVVGLERASELIRDEDWLILDGDGGALVVAPDAAMLADYRRRQETHRLEQSKLRRLIDVPAVTRDGEAIELHSNIEEPEEAAEAYELGAAGIGLFRSEFLFMNRRDLPSEDEQYEAYCEAVRAMRGRPVTIRTLDIGADKTLSAADIPAALNPALGQRAIRYCLAEPQMFGTQLRAILRASAHGPVRLLLPMLAHLHEIDQSLALIEQARVALADRGIAVGPVPVGGMIEIPAAALTATLFGRRLDFLSIGTNDLIQYTLAIDRADHAVASLYEPFHPAVLRLIAQTIRAGRRIGTPVAVCGEMAGDIEATRLLLGLGLTEFSMNSSSLLRVKREVLEADVRELAPRVARLLRSDDAVRIRAGLRQLREAAS